MCVCIKPIKMLISNFKLDLIALLAPSSKRPHRKTSSHPILLSQKATFITYIISFFNTPNISKLNFFPISFKYSFFNFFYYFSFSLPFPLFLPQPLASASISSKPIPSKITRSKSQQKITQIKQAPEIHLPPQQNHNKSKNPDSPLWRRNPLSTWIATHFGDAF